MRYMIDIWGKMIVIVLKVLELREFIMILSKFTLFQHEITNGASFFFLPFQVVECVLFCYL